MAFSERSARTERELKRARIWLNQFAKFHQHYGESDWAFSAEEVIAFSRFHLKNGMPAWKRLKMVQALMNFRRQIQKRPTETWFLSIASCNKSLPENGPKSGAPSRSKRSSEKSIRLCFRQAVA